VFGLTGGIGSGKSRVADLLRQRGVPVVDADALARDAVSRGSPGLSAVVDAFGTQYLTPEGTLDRKRLAAHVFESDEARRRLNAIVHPAVRELAQQRFAELTAAGVELAAYEVPLLFEVGLDAVLRPVVVVAATPERQLERVMARDGLTAEEARARIAPQLPLAEKRARADYVLENDGPESALPSAVDSLLAWLRSSAEA